MSGAGSQLDLVGAGGHASVVVGMAVRLGVTRVTVWYETRPHESRFPSATRLASVNALPAGTPVVLGMGDIASRRDWRERFPKLASAVIDPSAVVGYGAVISGGVVLMPGVIVNPNAQIDEDAILNTGCIVEHDCRVGRNTHISPGVRVGGGAKIGANALIGTGAVVLPGINVGDGAVVGAGAVVTEDVAAETTVVGVPARAQGAIRQ
jgi:sugar O-acyltransferase (sialic acid O-acetyltransferase NeuD family)